MDVSLLKTDQKLENDGTWIDAGDGTRLLIASIHSESYQKAIATRRRPYENLINAIGWEKIPQGDRTEIAVLTLADAILLGWEKLIYEGEELPYSRENALMLLRDVPHFRRIVAGYAENIANFRAEARNGNSKSSGSSSAGGGSSAALPKTESATPRASTAGVSE